MMEQFLGASSLDSMKFPRKACSVLLFQNTTDVSLSHLRFPFFYQRVNSKALARPFISPRIQCVLKKSVYKIENVGEP